MLYNESPVCQESAIESSNSLRRQDQAGLGALSSMWRKRELLGGSRSAAEIEAGEPAACCSPLDRFTVGRRGEIAYTVCLGRDGRENGRGVRSLKVAGGMRWGRGRCEDRAETELRHDRQGSIDLFLVQCNLARW